jgi:hypothetical protein
VRIGVRLAALAGVALLVFAVPLGSPRPVLAITGSSAAPRQRTREYDLTLPRPSEEITIRTRAELSGTGAGIELLSGDNRLLYRQPLRAHGEQVVTFSAGGGFHAGRYRVRIREGATSGRYQVEFMQQHPITRWQRILLFLATALAATGVVYGYVRVSARRGHARPSLTWSGGALGAAVVVTACVVGGTALHEGGHAAAMAVFGVSNLRGSDLIGIHGAPYARATKSLDQLPGWQHAIIGVAGVGATTLVGYVLYALWASGRGRRWLSKSRRLSVYGSVICVALLIPPLGWLLPLMGVMKDTDYSGFVEGLGLSRLVVGALLAGVCVVNAVMIGAVARRLLATVREVQT